MLHHRSFKPAKCNTALKLAVSRIKLLKNKREAHMKQLRSELAQLLHFGHHHAARVRVEHVVMEEKTMAAYDLMEIYCKLIAACMPMIESQRNCPIDLKEAISSVIFASPRCLDITELVDVRKHITAKYGREFVSAAVELRPDCGLVEKLSTKAPDGPTKIKILTAIAEEHNVKWQPSLEEYDVKESQDLLAEPNTSEKATYVEPPTQLHLPLLGDEKRPPNLRASYQLKEMQDISKNSYEKNASLNSSGTGSLERHFGNLYLENMGAFQMGRQNWNMEFKDAASAAQAAAESAERASVAARAAAELSNREKLTRQCSSEWQSSAGELPQEYAFHAAKHLSAAYVNSTFPRSSLSLKDDPLSMASKTSGAGHGGKSSRVSYESKDQKVSFMDNWASSEHGSEEHAASKPSSEPKSEEIITFSARVQPSSSLTKTMIPDKEQASKSSNSNEDIPSKEKANHVHPKLPDYDTFAAQFRSRKKGR
ncbi:IST protein [Spatholobus suberectus]|nr:IST protein [Spatholobus suberectus]